LLEAAELLEQENINSAKKAEKFEKSNEELQQ